MLGNYVYIMDDTAKQLLRLARISCFEKGDIQDAPDLAKSIDRFFRKENNEIGAVFAPIYVNLKKHGRLDLLPRELRSRMKRHYFRVISLDTKITRETDNVLEQFTRAGIQAALLKGSAFNRHLYPPQAPRLMSDIDVLVHVENFKRAGDVIREMGYSPSKGEMMEEKARNPILFRQAVYSWGFVKSTGLLSYNLDLHHQVCQHYLFTPDVDRMFSDALKICTDNGKAMRVLAPEDALLNLAIHAVKSFHVHLPPHAFLDAHELICQTNLDWTVLTSKARAYHAMAALFAFLSMVKSVLKTPVQSGFLRSIRPPGYIRKYIERYYLPDRRLPFGIERRNRVSRAVNYAIMTDRSFNLIKYSVLHFFANVNR